MTSRPPRVMAIDLALRKTGIACVSTMVGDRPLVWTFDSGARTGHDREVAIIAELRRAVNLCRPELVLLEDVYVPASGRLGAGFLGLAFLHGVVRYYLSGVCPWITVNNSYVKMFAVGKGSGVGTDKHNIILSVERRYGNLVTVEDDNQADAFILAAMACHRYGNVLPTSYGKELPQTHLRALDMITEWPDLKGIHRS